MYEGPAFIPYLCGGIRTEEGGGRRLPLYWATAGMWYHHLKEHPWRTLKPDLAELFVVPFPIEESNDVGQCEGKSHMERVETFMQTLEQSPYFKKSWGHDHFWPVGTWQMAYVLSRSDIMPLHRFSFTKNMTLAPYAELCLSREGTIHGFQVSPVRKSRWWTGPFRDWRCSLVTPGVTPPGLIEQTSNPHSFEQWNSRPISIFFRGKSRACLQGGQKIRDRALKLDGVVPNTLISNNHSQSSETYIQEISSSKFCLVMRCDDPQTSRFYDAVAAGCIPVIISDGWHQIVAPFRNRINYHSFTITIPESIWNEHTISAARFIYHRDVSEFKDLYHNLIHVAQPALLWRHPRSIVAHLGLQELKEKCLTSPWCHFFITNDEAHFLVNLFICLLVFIF